MDNHPCTGVMDSTGLPHEGHVKYTNLYALMEQLEGILYRMVTSVYSGRFKKLMDDVQETRAKAKEGAAIFPPEEFMFRAFKEIGLN
eukprot:5483584-Amphidinium_carterae.1